MDSNHNNWRLVKSSKALRWALRWTSLTYVCPNITNLKTQFTLLSNLKVKLGCIIRTKRANFFLAYSSTFVTHVVTLLTAIVYKQVQGHIVVWTHSKPMSVSIGKHKSDLYFGPDFFLLSFFGGFRKYQVDLFFLVTWTIFCLIVKSNIKSDIKFGF